MATRRLRREREILAARQTVVEAAIDVFAQHGYHNTTVEQLAATAGYSVGSLYNYFTGKEDIYRGVMEQVTTEIRNAVMVDLPPSVGFLDALRWLNQRHLDVLSRYRAFIQTHYGERASFDSSLGSQLVALQDSLGEAWRDRLRTMVEEAQARGELRRGSPVAVVAMVTGVLASSLFLWLHEDLDPQFEVSFDELIGFMAHGIVPGSEVAS